MELFLNLIWLLLVFPALLLLRKRKPCLGSSSALIVLGCCLVLLFPIISLSDDLQAMRSEAVEIGPGKRALAQTGRTASLHSFGVDHARPVSFVRDVDPMAVCGMVEPQNCRAVLVSFSNFPSGRAPPSVFPA